MKRFRRLKKTETIRRLVRDVSINLDNFVYPLFIIEGTNIKDEINSMPGQFRFSIDKLEAEIDEIYSLGIKSVLLFGIPKIKDRLGSQAYDKDGIIQKAIRLIKQKQPDMMVIGDVCMCEYTSHGHCGIVKDNKVDNDTTLDYLGKIALAQAEAGVDIIAPSDMMDGRVSYLRNILDNVNFKDVAIMSYSIKYSSSYYGPFREAAESSPEFGDRKTYQMDFFRKKEALDKILTDINEGADIAIVKPALAYLDIIKTVSKKINIPIAAYNVSGEYSMVKAASLNGWIDEKKIVMENMASFKRAGADIIISYHAKDIAKWLKEGF